MSSFIKNLGEQVVTCVQWTTNNFLKISKQVITYTEFWYRLLLAHESLISYSLLTDLSLGSLMEIIWVINE